MRAYSVTDIGLCRKENQDYVLCEEKTIGSLPNLFLVADGMGGHNGGAYASRCCVETIKKSVNESKLPSAVMTLKAAIEQANARIIKRAEEYPELVGMGTTIVAATFENQHLHVANVGDSRLYVCSKGKLRQVTEDHSLVEEMIRKGELAREEARFHPNKNIITRALGGQPEVEVDFFEVALESNDKILLCSDGLTNMLSDEDIEEILSIHDRDVEKAVKTLVQQANVNGGKDNITVVLVET